MQMNRKLLTEFETEALANLVMVSMTAFVTELSDDVVLTKDRNNEERAMEHIAAKLRA